jgi:hypothetical protein
LSLAVFFLLPVAAQAQIEITLKKSFIEKYKDRATIEADFFVDKAHKKPDPPSKDGDMRIAGRSPEEIGLPIVAEIMNASGAPSAKKQMTLPALRLWFLDEFSIHLAMSRANARASRGTRRGR